MCGRCGRHSPLSNLFEIQGPDVWRPRNRTLETVFSGCAANAACRAAYLDLRTCFYDRVHALRRDPVVVDLPVEGGGTVSFTVDGDVSLDDVSLCSGDPFCAAELPGLLDVMADGADPTGHDAPIPETYFRWAIVRMLSDGTALIAPMGT